MAERHRIRATGPRRGITAEIDLTGTGNAAAALLSLLEQAGYAITSHERTEEPATPAEPPGGITRALVDELLGAAPDHCGGLTVDQYTAWQRDPDYDGPEPNWLEPALRPDATERTDTP